MHLRSQPTACPGGISEFSAPKFFKQSNFVPQKHLKTRKLAPKSKTYRIQKSLLRLLLDQSAPKMCAKIVEKYVGNQTKEPVLVLTLLV